MWQVVLFHFRNVWILHIYIASDSFWNPFTQLWTTNYHHLFNEGFTAGKPCSLWKALNNDISPAKDRIKRDWNQSQFKKQQPYAKILRYTVYPTKMRMSDNMCQHCGDFGSTHFISPADFQYASPAQNTSRIFPDQGGQTGSRAKTRNSGTTQKPWSCEHSTLTHRIHRIHGIYA